MLIAVMLAMNFVPQLQEGDVLPAVVLEDQQHHRIQIGPHQRSIQVITFFYARCPDLRICSTMSGKFAWLQQHMLSDDRLSLVEITLDPEHDTTANLENYARAFGANEHIWHLAKATPRTTTNLLRRFAIVRQRTASGSIVHSELVAIIRQDGTIATIMHGTTTNPEDILNLALEAEGQQTCLLRRMRFWLQQNAGTLCGRPSASGFLTTGMVLGLLTIACIAGTITLLRICKLF